MHLNTLKALVKQYEGIREVSKTNVEIYVKKAWRADSLRASVKTGKELLSALNAKGESWQGEATRYGSYKLKLENRV